MIGRLSPANDGSPDDIIDLMPAPSESGTQQLADVLIQTALCPSPEGDQIGQRSRVRSANPAWLRRYFRACWMNAFTAGDRSSRRKAMANSTGLAGGEIDL
jgi:hypothetical protein